MFFNVFFSDRELCIEMMVPKAHLGTASSVFGHQAGTTGELLLQILLGLKKFFVPKLGLNEFAAQKGARKEHLWSHYCIIQYVKCPQSCFFERMSAAQALAKTNSLCRN